MKNVTKCTRREDYPEKGKITHEMHRTGGGWEEGRGGGGMQLPSQTVVNRMS